MKLDAVSVPNVNSTGRVNAPAPAKEAAVTLSEGDVVRARVVAAKDGEVTLKTADGLMFNARLEDGVELPQGSFARLVVTQSASDVIVMSLASPVPESGVAPDAATQALAGQLSSMGAMPDGQMLAALKDIFIANPNIAPEEAAFMAANRLPPEPGIMEAVHALFSGEADTAQMLAELESLAARAGAESAAQAGTGNTAQTGSETVVQTGAEAAVANGADAAAQTGANPAAQQGAEGAVPGAAAQQGADPAVIVQGAAEAVQTQAPVSAEESAVAAKPEGAPQENAVPKENLAAQGDAAAVAKAGENTQTANTAKPPMFTQWLAKALAVETQTITYSTLSGSHLFEGLSSRSLSGIAESLQNIAASMPGLENEQELFESISRFARELFLGKDQSAEDIASKLKGVREELYVKLSYFKDAVSSSGAASKEMVLQQTEKLMEHVRLLNNLDQFAYIQIPLHENLGRGNAELYIYKNDKGGSKRIDPEDVKILLALDLEHMGHLESFIEVRGREVSLRCDVASDEIASVFRQNTTNLHKMLDDIGYKFINFNASVKKSVTGIENSLLALLDYEKSKSSGVDYRV